MHDGMPYGRIQGQGPLPYLTYGEGVLPPSAEASSGPKGHEPLKVLIPSIFKTYLLRHLQWELANDH